MTGFPALAAVGLSGLLVRFGDTLSEPANRAALALRAAVEAEGWDGVEECATSLVSTFLRFDPLRLPLETLEAQVHTLLQSRDWYAEPLPQGRSLIRIPTVYGGAHGPQLEEAAAAAGVDTQTAVAELSSARTRVTTIGFAPGQPYLGTLPEHWNIPRQTSLTPNVPRGALVVAIRQLVLFSNPMPTGWRQIGLTAVQLFQPDAPEPFVLKPGDEVEFPAVSAERLAELQASQMGGATRETLP
ncbi:MAG: carboxyltransferase domain-containing protein [Paracoccaceae bacterium]|nr:carboxyltransferase domain-containing protein [Paracoccaceae bacterium]